MNQSPLVAVRSTTRQLKQPDLRTPERALSVIAGSLLLINALRRGGPSGWLQAVAGAYSLIRGVSGNCPLKRVLKETPFEQHFQHTHGWKASEAISRSVTIARPLDEVFEFLKQPQNIGPLIPWVDTLESLDPHTSKWTVRGPLGRTINWTLHLDEFQEDSILRWHTVPAGKWQHDITAQLKPAPASRGTELKVVAVCEPAGGPLGYALASAVSSFSDKALLNLLGTIKQQLETGEVSTNEMRAQEVRDFIFLHAHTHENGETSHSQRDDVAEPQPQPEIERGNI